MDEKIIAHIAETLGRVDARTERMEKDLSGTNGTPGLKQRVEDLEEYKNKQVGAIVATTTIGGSLWALLEWVFHFKGGK